MLNHAPITLLLAAIIPLVTAQVPSTPDIFHLTNCSSVPATSRVIYFKSQDSPHPATKPDDIFVLPNATTFAGTIGAAQIEDLQFWYDIDAGALAKDAGVQVGQGEVSFPKYSEL